MAFRSTSETRIYIAHLLAAAYARSMSTSSTTDMLNTTTFCETNNASHRAKIFIPNQDTSTFQIAGPLDVDPTANGQADAVQDMKDRTTPTAITYMPLGTDGAGWLFEALANGLELSTGVGQTADWALSAQTTGITDMNGVVLSNNEAVTDDGSSSNTDNGAASPNGLVAHLHVTAFSGLTSDAIIIEGSANGSTGWATVATFTTVTGLTSERVAVSGSVARYLRVTDDVTGTGSISRLVAVSRR